MRTYTAHHVRYRAHRVQEWAFYVGAGFAAALIGFALADMVKAAAVAIVIGSLALGISIGAWIVGAWFKD